jgi:hypothetical protein
MVMLWIISIIIPAHRCVHDDRDDSVVDVDVCYDIARL